MKKLLSFAMMAALIGSAFAENEYVWIGTGSIDWTDGNNYSNVTTAAVGEVPTAGDILQIPTNTTVKLVSTDHDSVDLFNSLLLVRPMTENSWLELNTPKATDTLIVSNRVHYMTMANATQVYQSFTHGGIIKTGLGEVILAGNTGATTTHTCKIHVKEGKFWLYPMAKHNTYYKNITTLTVDEDGTCYLPYEEQGNQSCFIYCYGIYGEGKITCELPAGKTIGSFINLRNSDNIYTNTIPRKRFEGVLAGKMSITTDTTFMPGNRNTMSGMPYLTFGGAKGTYPDGPRLEIERFGMNNDGLPSSIGNLPAVRFYGYADDDSYGNKYEDSGAIRYMGTGETTDKNIILDGSSQYPDFIDAGKNGDLHLIGKIMASSGANYKKQLQNGYRLILTGDNAKPSSFTGTIAQGKASDDANFITTITNVTKTGSGMWTFAPSNVTEWPGELWAEEGTLGFVGVPTNRVIAKNGVTLEFKGATDVAAAKRKIFVSGNVTLKNHTGKKLILGGISSIGGATLTIDCSAGSKIVLSDIKDGAGQLSIVKVGDGDLDFDGAHTFTGSLVINGGKARAMRPQYTYYRFSIKEMYGNKQLTYGGLHELGLWDSDRVRIGAELTYDSTVARKLAPQLAENEIAFAPSRTVQTWWAAFPVGGSSRKDSNPLTWFTGKNSKFSACYWYTGDSGYSRPTVDNPDSWQMYVIHLSRDRKPVKYYDYLRTWHNNEDSYVAVKASSFEVSVDGENWVMADDHVWEGTIDSNHHWEYGGVKFSGNYEDNVANYDCRKGLEVPTAPPSSEWPSCLDSLTTVQVANGAKFVADGEGFGMNSITVDCASKEAGIYTGFTFADSGKLNLTNADDLKSDKILPINLSGSTGGANISKWDVYVNGVRRGWKLVVMADGRIRLARTGILIIAE